MKNVTLISHPTNYTLFARYDESKNAIYGYVVAYAYDEATDEWVHGHYFFDLADALNCLRWKTGMPTMDREEEICTEALHYIHNELDLREFEEEYDLEFSDEELMYFGFADLI